MTWVIKLVSNFLTELWRIGKSLTLFQYCPSPFSGDNPHLALTFHILKHIKIKIKSDKYTYLDKEVKHTVCS